MALEFKLNTVVKGGLVYAFGDMIASIISDDLSLQRFLGVLFIGATVYAFEIPNFFNWIDKKVKADGSLKLEILRASMAMFYFNPLWIARHILFIKIFSGNIDQISWELLTIGLISFLVNIPVSLFINYLIQNKISLQNRFLASSIFSGVMAVYYSLSETWFG